MHPKRAVFVALVAATWLAIAGVVLLVWGTLLTVRHPGATIFGAASLGVAAVMVVVAIRSLPR